MTYCPIAYITTRIENITTVNGEVGSPIKTESWTMDISIMDVISIIDMTAVIKVLLIERIANLTNFNFLFIT